MTLGKPYDNIYLTGKPNRTLEKEIDKMNKKQAYELVNYLLDEAYGILNYAEHIDVKAISNLLGTAIYLTKSYQLKEKEQIECRIHTIRREAYKYVEIISKSLDTIFY